MAWGSCQSCLYFVPDSIGFGQGIGFCKQYEHYRSKGLTDKEMDKLFLMLGNRLFWGSTHHNPDRECFKFERVAIDVETI